MNRLNSIWSKLESARVFFVAEIGKNFIQSKEEKGINEYIANAKRLIDQAKKAGADAVKFQTHWAEDEQVPARVVSPHFKGADRYSWVMRNSRNTPYRFWREVKDYCEREKIYFFSTPMSRSAAMHLSRVGVPAWKIASGDILDFVLLDYVRNTGKPIIISSGMSSIEELEWALRFIMAKCERVVLLYCVSKYPCRKDEFNLNMISNFLRDYGIPVGFSDHSIGYESVLKAVKLGAKVIEKHFSLDRNWWGSDHKVSMTPDEFREMVGKVRVMEARGESNSIKKARYTKRQLADKGSVFRPYFRKSLVAGRDIKAGQIINKDMIYAMRPQKYIKGWPSQEYCRVVGKMAKRDMRKYEPFSEDRVTVGGAAGKVKAAV